VRVEPLATGFQAPLDVTFAPDADRRYVADQEGRVYVHGADGLRDEPLLDLRDSIEYGGEKGLLGITLHPNFAENRRLFVRYSAPRRSGTPSRYSHTFVLAEFAVDDDGVRARRDSERTILEIPEPQSNHNAGSVLFGPDGYLYVGVGDGGAGGDQGTGHVDDWYDAVGGGNGQDVTENLLGSVLRIDVDGEPTVPARKRGDATNLADDAGYAIPGDNPLVGGEGLDEHYAWGLRNPWRMSFDRGRLFVADVGQSSYEEVSLVEKGGNYGWNVREGAHCYRADDCPDETPASVRGGEPLVDPIVEYPHSGAAISGVSVIGGYVYRGSALPGLVGRYVFGDLSANGRLFVASEPGGDGGAWSTGIVEIAGGDAPRRILSFGRDPAGEVYVLGTGSDGGSLYRVVPAN
jgi:glucose/arabinose dehydrogenase